MAPPVGLAPVFGIQELWKQMGYGYKKDTPPPRPVVNPADQGAIPGQPMARMNASRLGNRKYGLVDFSPPMVVEAAGGA